MKSLGLATKTKIFLIFIGLVLSLLLAVYSIFQYTLYVELMGAGMGIGKSLFNKLSGSLFFVSILSGVIIIFIGLFIFKLFVSRFDSAVNKLFAGIENFGEGKLSYRIDIPKDDASGILAGALNAMADNLQKVIIDEKEQAVRRAFSQDTAGDLLGGSVFSFIDVLPGMFCVCDYEWNLLRWNKKFEQISEYSWQELSSLNLLDLFKEKSGCSKNENITDEAFSEIEVDLLSKNGRVNPYSITGQRISNEIKKYFVVIGVDIAAHRDIEKELRLANKEMAAQKMALNNVLVDLQNAHNNVKQAQMQLLQSEKLASIGQLAAGIAHEINNPVGFIDCNLHTLEQYITSLTQLLYTFEVLNKAINSKDLTQIKKVAHGLMALEEKINLSFILTDINDLVQESLAGSERIKKIVMDLRTFAREDRNKIEDINVTEIIDNIINIAFNEIKYKAELIRNYKEVPLIKGNPQTLGQVFINLILNASYAIKENGVIEINVYQENKYVYIEVKDNGCGIDEENIKKIFDAFFTTKPTGQGTGLGLSLSLEIVKKHGGEVQVESAVGKGTTFKVLLPAG